MPPILKDKHSPLAFSSYPLFSTPLPLEIWAASTELLKGRSELICLTLVLFSAHVFGETLSFGGLLFHLYLFLSHVGSEAISYFPSEAYC